MAQSISYVVSALIIFILLFIVVKNVIAIVKKIKERKARKKSAITLASNLDCPCVVENKEKKEVKK